LVDNQMRGRVMGIYSMMFLGLAPFGNLIAGFIAERLGAPAAVQFFGAACIAGSMAFAWRRRGLNIESLLGKGAQ